MKQQGVNRVVMAVRDIEAGRAFYEELLDCTFHPANDEEAAAFGVKVLMSWDGGIELVAPIEGAGSHIETILEQMLQYQVDGILTAAMMTPKQLKMVEGIGIPVVFYNRANEAGAMLKPGDFDWAKIFGDTCETNNNGNALKTE